MPTSDASRAFGKCESVREALFILLQNHNVDSDSYKIAQLADNLAYIAGTTLGHDVILKHTKFFIVLSLADSTWRLTFLYEDETLLSGHRRSCVKDALDGLFLASAKKMSKFVNHSA